MTRRTSTGVCLVIAFLALAAHGVGAADAVKRETSEWCNMWWDHANDPKLPRVLLIGDSISLGYHRTVIKELKGKAHVDILATSKGINDPALLKETSYVLGEYRYKAVHFNNGLHGWHIGIKDYESALGDYAVKLRELAQGARLIWATTTPFASKKEGEKLRKEKNDVVLARNAAAAAVMRKHKIPVNDLYSLVLGDLDKLTASKGNLHYNKDGKELQGKAVAKALLDALKP